MLRYVVIEKSIGETPLAALAAWRLANPTYATIPASYAGRLDPMASGKLLVLLGEECKKQRAYTRLDKEYVVEVLLDVGSDTGDVLGLVEYAQTETSPTSAELAAVLGREQGAHTHPYPAYSSKTLRGKPLFLHSLEGTLAKSEIPTHEEHLFNLTHLSTTRASSRALTARIAALLELAPRTTEPSKELGADFRIDAVRSAWATTWELAGERDFEILTLRVTCGSGTYMRSLAARIGESLGTKSLALSIKRTKIGRYAAFGRFGFWLRTY